MSAIAAETQQEEVLLKHRKYMLLALEQAAFALEDDEVPVGCVIVDDNTGAVIASAWNQTNHLKNATAHCEFMATNQLLLSQHPHQAPLYDESVFSHCTLYVTIEPCIMCAAALAHLRIRHVVFGASNERFGGCGSVYALHKDKQQNEIYTITPDVYAAEAITLMQQFYARGNPNAPDYKRTRPLQPR